MQNTRTLLLICLSLLTSSLGLAQRNHNFESAKALDIFNTIYRDLDLFYVDTLNAEKTIGDALLYMLNQLDPYTEFYKENRAEEFRTMTTGKYAGIGSPIRFHKASDRCVFENPYKGMPADKAGVRTGDIILKVNGKDVGVCGKQPRNTYSTSVSSQLRGEPGTSFILTVKRPGVEKPLQMKLTRETIKRPSVNYTQLRDGNIGYILLDSYTEETGNELRAALESLKDQGATRIILDLRSNGGGLMKEAVKVVNLFIPKGKLVLETKGKDPENNQTYLTTNEPLDRDIPMVVLVNYGTASAAEITSGCMQDYDRAVIIGRRTYGKGLVQSTRPLPYQTLLKLTTAKYYIPSGRCVQAYDFKNRGSDGQPKHLPDSLCQTFKTMRGRTVKDGGGITPDVMVQLDSMPNLVAYLSPSETLFDFVVAFRHRHKSIAPANEFSLSDEEFENFKRFVANSDFTYDNQTKKALEQIRKLAAFEGYAETAKAEFDALEAKLSHNITDDLELWKKEIKKIVESTIILNYYGQQGFVEYMLRHDRDYEAAVNLLNDMPRYKSLLRK